MLAAANPASRNLSAAATAPGCKRVRAANRAKAVATFANILSSSFPQRAKLTARAIALS